jgi:hypothetical protein
MFFQIQASELLVTAVASGVAIFGIILNARRCYQPFPILWVLLAVTVALSGHAWSFGAESKWPAFIALALLVALAYGLGWVWSREMRKANHEPGEDQP